MRSAGLDEAQAGIKIARRNINNLRYADDITLKAENEEEINSVTIYTLMYAFPNLETVHCSMSGSNFYLLNSIHISQETGQVLLYLLFQKETMQKTTNTI